MLIKTVGILGGTGFVGQVIANRLTELGLRLRVLTRNRERNRQDLIILPKLDLVETNIHVPAKLTESLAGCDAVINLVGILNEHGRDGSGFRSVHFDLVEKLINACRANGIRRILHMSALNADAQNGPSHYLRTKGMGEDALHKCTDLRVTSFRPSVIFGPNDSFFNRFAQLLQITPWLFPLACPRARFAPVYVDDVADAFARVLTRPDSYGRRYDLCGPHTYTLEELVEYTAGCLGLTRKVIPLSNLLSRMQGAVFDFIPGKPFSTDNYLSTRVDSVCECNHLEELGIHPTPLESIVPRYLAHRSQRARYHAYRSQTRRNAGT